MLQSNQEPKPSHPCFEGGLANVVAWLAGPSSSVGVEAELLPLLSTERMHCSELNPSSSEDSVVIVEGTSWNKVNAWRNCLRKGQQLWVIKPGTFSLKKWFACKKIAKECNKAYTLTPSLHRPVHVWQHQFEPMFFYYQQYHQGLPRWMLRWKLRLMMLFVAPSLCIFDGKELP